MTGPRKISVMGSTGSIGRSTLSVVEYANRMGAVNGPAFEVEALVAGADVDALIEQALRFQPQLAVIADETKAEALKAGLRGTNIGVAAGAAAVAEAASRPCDRVVGAIVGAAGLASTLAAIRAGNDVALANKESIVCAGPFILAEAERAGVNILPVDSEHNAIFQALQNREGLERLSITASGGPFRTWSREEMAAASPEAARAHPVWDMGVKNSIDSASLMNKALEFIEASYLFDMGPERIDVLVHPQSIIHGMAHYSDGSVIAELGAPDMRTPIAHALVWPDRIETETPKLNLAEIGRLEFEPVDELRFPAIRLARASLQARGGAPTILNCANEEAVAAFIRGDCGFLDINRVVEASLDRFAASEHGTDAASSLEAIAEFDRIGRQTAQSLLASI